MAAPSETTATIPRLRTYASDLDRARNQESGAVAPQEKEKQTLPDSDKREVTQTAAETKKATLKQEAAAALRDVPKPPPTPPKPAPPHPPKPPVKKEEEKGSAKAPHLSSIPSFHELTKHGRKKNRPSIDKEEVAKAAAPTRDSLLEHKSKTVSLEDESTMGDDGVVITDTKRGQFKFFSSIAKSLTEWVKDLKESWIDNRKPVYTINETSNRTSGGAAAKTGRDEVVDHRVVVERLKNRPRASATDTRAVVKPDKDQQTHWDEAAAEASREVHPEWRHVTNDNGKEVPLLEEGEHEVVASTPAPPPPPVSTPAPRPEPEPVQPPAPPQVETPAPPPAAEGAWSSESTEPSEPAPTPEPEPAPAPQAPTNTTPANTRGEGQLIPNASGWAKRVENTNTLSLGIVATIAIVVTVVIGGRLVYVTFMSPAPEEVVETAPAPLLEQVTTVQLPVATTDSAATVIALLNEQLQSNQAEVMVLALVREGDDTPLPATTLFSTLAIAPTDTLLRTTRRAAIGGVNGTHPFLVLDIENHDSALSGMLAWEGYMHTELAPLFGDSLLEANLQERVTGFADETIADADTRILYDTDENERLVYGFVGTTLIITTNASTFATVAERVE